MPFNFTWGTYERAPSGHGSRFCFHALRCITFLLALDAKEMSEDERAPLQQIENYFALCVSMCTSINNFRLIGAWLLLPTFLFRLQANESRLARDEPGLVSKSELLLLDQKQKMEQRFQGRGTKGRGRASFSPHLYRPYNHGSKGKGRGRAPASKGKGRGRTSSSPAPQVTFSTSN